jgi:hypothetical protein
MLKILILTRFTERNELNGGGPSIKLTFDEIQKLYFGRHIITDNNILSSLEVNNFFSCY